MAASRMTKGPWRLDIDDLHVFAGDMMIAGCGGHSDNFTEGLRETQQANARAIACLPDLVEAARQAVRNLGKNDSPGPISDMRRILARIDGETGGDK